MNPKTKVPAPRTRTGCVTCRKKKVKCDEYKPTCQRCRRLDRFCLWEDIECKVSAVESGIQAAKSKVPAIDREIKWFLKYFRRRDQYLVYPYDRGDLFQSLARSEPLQHSMAAVAASICDEKIISLQEYNEAVEALRRSILNDDRNDSELGSCLLLCVYEILTSGNGLENHLKGASTLLRYSRPSQEYSRLTRFCHLLDVSNAISSGRAPVLDHYWKDSYPDLTCLSPWPWYDTENVAATSFQGLMKLMARLARFSQSIAHNDQQLNYKEKIDFYNDLRAWWEDCPSVIRCQSNDWRENIGRKLFMSETLLQEQFTSIRACMHGCYLYLQHILDPLGRRPMEQKCYTAVQEIWEILNKAPPGEGLELGLEWSVFMLGISIVNDLEKETGIRNWFQTKRESIFPANALVLLEALWAKQHRNKCKYNWRQVKMETGINCFILI